MSNNLKSLHRTTSAKTRATATLRQLHIPPNVMCHIITQPITYDMKRLIFILPALMLISCNPKNDYKTILLKRPERLRLHLMKQV